jgi:squalene-hopene/tetraprenyl-beta-curcumene cyclase
MFPTTRDFRRGIPLMAATLMVTGALSFTLADDAATPGGLTSLQRAAADVSMQRGIDWLARMQQESGAWSNPDFPAITAMALSVMARSGREDLIPHIQRATDFILTCVRPSGPDKGAIYRPVPDRVGGGLSNYNTALSILGLQAVMGSPHFPAINKDNRYDNLVRVVLDARAFMAASQYLGESTHFGGMGYDPPTERFYADLSNAYLGYEAMRVTQDLEELRGGTTRVDLNWMAAIKYIQRIQNLPASNDMPWATDHPDEIGGFTYRTDTVREDFGSFIDDQGVLRYRSALTMTYAGLTSYIFAGLDRNDERISAAIAWIRNHWDPLKSNRNPELAGTPSEMGGYFYYLKVMTRALDLYGSDTLVRPSGESVHWRSEVIAAILKQQRDEGFWVNDYGRYWESDPVLATAYALMALQNALGL